MGKNSCSTICERAMKLFQRFGLKAVTMDDVSKEMSISKKTLYTFFQNKSDLVDQAIRKKMKSHKSELDSIKKSKENAIEDFRALIGATNPAEAAEGTIRKLFASSMTENAVHGSDSNANAAIETAFHFSERELF